MSPFHSLPRRSAALAVVVAALTSACASPVYNYAPRRLDVSEPPLGSTVTVAVGDSLVRQGTYVEQDAILLPADTWVGNLGGYTLKAGYYAKRGTKGEHSFYLPSNQEGGAILPAPLTDPPQAVRAHESLPELCVITVFNALVCESGVTFERVSQPVMARDAFQQTLIYSGRVGSKINIGYREFSNNLARPAFNNDVEYDLTESRIIGYKGARLEVLEATNESITYRVLRNFNATAE